MIFALNAFADNRITPVVEAIRKIESSVVNIRTEKLVNKAVINDSFFNDPFFSDNFSYKKVYKTKSLGSGVIIDNRGIIVTNYHVVKDASRIFVILSDGDSYEAEFIGGDQVLDIAILKVINTERRFPRANMADSDKLILGEPVIAIGNPFGLTSSVTTGVISALNRVIKMSRNNYSVFIQTDALINPGNSGGPLININGDLIGINTAIFKKGQGIGFSIPINTVKRVLPDILKYRKIRKGYLGFTVKEVKVSDDRTKVMVTAIDKKSRSYEKGIRSGDEIVSVGGIPTTTVSGLNVLLRSYPPASYVTIAVKRGETSFLAQIMLDKYPENYGLIILKEKFGINIGLVQQYIVVTGSKNPKYIKKGDVVVSLNGQEINTMTQLNDLIENFQNEPMLLYLYRNGKTIKIRLKP